MSFIHAVLVALGRGLCFTLPISSLVLASRIALAQEGGLTGTCDDLLDNDGDGYVDGYDVACQPAPLECSYAVEAAPFAIALHASTSAVLEDLFWPIVADVDADGSAEVVVANRDQARIEILNGATLALESHLPVNGNRGDNFTVANLDSDPELELITIIHGVRRMIVADWSGSAWVLNTSSASELAFDAGGNVGSGLGLSVADFDQDGTPEIYYGNEIWTYPADLSAGCSDCIVKRLDMDRDVASSAAVGRAALGGGAQGVVSVAADVLSSADCADDAECDGLELIVAYQVFSVDVAAGTATLRRDANTMCDRLA